VGVNTLKLRNFKVVCKCIYLIINVLSVNFEKLTYTKILFLDILIYTIYGNKIDSRYVDSIEETVLFVLIR